MIKTPMMILTAGVIAVGFSVTVADAKGGPDRGPRASFETLDADGNGQITQAELTAHRAAAFAERDTNGDGQLTVEEIVKAADDRQAKRAERMIDRLDSNDDGAVSAEEMAAFEPRRGGMMRLDANDDGQISKAEFEDAKGKMGKRGKNRDAQ
ncbi:EF-hand domain-containing protein [Nereida sp. MMG025]|uniref:EF-hand domain-containing protein n=1 Tax=Nereida sp. MMG025 TaxID=2909981 RepID=UPI001F2A9B16|nr:calcium-binding protein [Nereida sp. MMG025]MCF6445105.1 calcium-binding protein [Nereida sp. MMG025]